MNIAFCELDGKVYAPLAAPPGATSYDEAKLKGLSLDELNRLYGLLTGVTKQFKNVSVAAASCIYQASKLKMPDGSESTTPGKKVGKTLAAQLGRVQPKLAVATMATLVTAAVDKLGELTPAARTVVSAAVDVAIDSLDVLGVGACKVPINVLASKLSLDEATVRRSLKKAAEVGVVVLA